MPNRVLCLLAILITATLGACSGGGVTTGSLLGGDETKKAPTDEPTERAMQAAATSARASKCGYNFDPAKLRQGYLTYETAQGASQEQIAKLEKVYDFTRTSIAGKITQEEGFCSDAKTKEIKENLTRRLAGDFSLPARKAYAQVPGGGWFGTSAQSEPLDREAIFDPMARGPKRQD